MLKVSEGLYLRRGTNSRGTTQSEWVHVAVWPPGYELKFHGEPSDAEFRHVKASIVGDAGFRSTRARRQAVQIELVCRMPDAQNSLLFNFGRLALSGMVS
jgi:hypothetical protein